MQSSGAAADDGPEPGDEASTSAPNPTPAGAPKPSGGGAAAAATGGAAAAAAALAEISGGAGGGKAAALKALQQPLLVSIEKLALPFLQTVMASFPCSLAWQDSSLLSGLRGEDKMKLVISPAAMYAWDTTYMPGKSNLSNNDARLLQGGKDAVIDIPAEARARADALDVRPAPGPAQPLLPAVLWALATLAGMLYMLTVLCLCAYAPTHFTVLLAQRYSMVRARTLCLCTCTPCSSKSVGRKCACA